MPWNGSGVFSRLRNWNADKNNGIKIVASLHDAEDDNLTAGIQACLTKNNESKPVADFRPNADNAFNLGSASLRWVRGFFSAAVRIFSGASNYVEIIPATLTAVRTITLPDISGNAVIDTAGYNFIQPQSFEQTVTFKARPTIDPVGTNPGDGGGFVIKELAANGSHSITIRAADAISNSYVITLPTQQGPSGSVPTNDGAGNLSWQSPSSIFAPVGVTPGDTGRIQLQELAANGSNVVRLRAADSMAVNFDLTLPATLPSVTSSLEFSTSGAGGYFDARGYADARRDEAIIINTLALFN